MQFELALAFLRSGKSIAREGWNGKGMFITIQNPDENSKMTRPYVYMTIPGSSTNQFGNDGLVANRIPWLCSQTDLLANDWVVVE